VTGTNVVVWQPGGWRERLHLKNDWEIEAVRVSPDGRSLATTTRRSTSGHDTGAHLTRVFDLASGAETGWQYTSGGGNLSQKYVEEEAARKKRGRRGVRPKCVIVAGPGAQGTRREQVSADRGWSVAVSGSAATHSDAASGRAIGDFHHGSEQHDHDRGEERDAESQRYADTCITSERMRRPHVREVTTQISVV
jgi:hypothetical protein